MLSLPVTPNSAATWPRMHDWQAPAGVNVEVGCGFRKVSSVAIAPPAVVELALVLGVGVPDGATAAEATQSSGVVRLTAEAGTALLLTFSGSAGRVSKTLLATGAEQPVVLSMADLAILGEGPVSVELIGRDGAARTVATGHTRFVLDTIAPPEPVVALGIGVADGATAAEATQISGVVTVTAESGTTLTVTFVGAGGTLVKTLTATGTVQAVVLNSADLVRLGEGSVSVTAVARDAAGNDSRSAGANFVLDTIAPLEPVVALGVGVADGATAAEATQTAGVVTVTAESGATLTMTFVGTSGSVSKTLTATGSAQAVVLNSSDLTQLGQGIVNVTAVARDAAGNDSGRAGTNFVLDTIAPPEPVVALGVGVADGATADEATQVTGAVTVTGESGATLTVTFVGTGGSVSKTLTVTGSAQAVVLNNADLARLGEGSVSVTAVARDAAGNVSGQGATGFVLDTVVSPATIHSIIGTDTGVVGSISSGGATWDNTLALQGTAEAGSLVQIYDGTVLLGTASLVGTGWTFTTPALAQGLHSLTARVTDGAGNSVTTSAVTVTVDTTAPDAPILALGTGVSDGATAAEATQATGVVTVSGESGATLTVTLVGTAGSVTKILTGTGAAQAVVLNSIDLTQLGQGIVNLTAIARDAAGNDSGRAGTNFVLDTIAPPEPVVALGVGVADGATAAEAVQAGGVVTVTAESGATLTVTLVGTAGSVIKTLTGTGSPQAVVLESADLARLGEGTIRVSAMARDAVGNVSGSSTASFVLDTITPSAPVLAQGQGVFGVANLSIATQSSGVMTVVGESGTRVEVTFTGSNGSVRTQTLVATGSVQALTLTPDDVRGLGDGPVLVSAWATDAAGNVSSNYLSHFVLDTVAPAPPVLALGPGVADGATAAEATQVQGVLTFTADASATVWLTLAGTKGSIDRGFIATGSAQSFVLTLEDLSQLGYGNVSVSAQVNDRAGNFSEISRQGFALNPGADPVDLSAVALGRGGFVIDGQGAGDLSGYTVSSGGDFNGDGLADLIIGAPQASPTASNVNAGRTYVVFGKTTTNDLRLSSLVDSGLGLVINGQGANDRSGYSVSSLGDVNGDGLDDLLIGAPYNDPASGVDAGCSYVVFGRKIPGTIGLSDIARGVGGFTITGQSAGDWSGWSVSALGDISRDGLADILVSAYGHDPSGLMNAGRAYVVYGKASTSAIALSQIALGSGGFVIDGSSSGEQSAWSVSGAGDVNGDGLADIIVSSPWSNVDTTRLAAGCTYIVFGSRFNNAIVLNNVRAMDRGFVIRGDKAGDLSGFSVSAAGDVNGDGLADLIVGAYKADPATGIDAGRSYVVFGKTSTTPVDLSIITAGLGGFVIQGQCAGDESSYSVSAAGDVNGDGLSDLLIGAKLSDPAGGTNAGRTYLVFGKTDTNAINLRLVALGDGGFVINGRCAGDQSGFSVSAAGDVNGDGLADFLVGAPYADTTAGVDAGQSYVIFGSTAGLGKSLSVGQVGADGDDTLTSKGSQTLVGGAGNDVFIASGADVLYGGLDNDVFVINQGMITALQSAFGAGGNNARLSRIDGAAGIDTIRLAGGASLDLTKVTHAPALEFGGGGRINSVERIDMATDAAANTVTLALNDVLDMAGMNLFSTSKGWRNLGLSTELSGIVMQHQLVIDGSANDTLNVVGTWIRVGQAQSWTNGAWQIYNVWNHDISAAQLLVDTDIRYAVI